MIEKKYIEMEGIFSGSRVVNIYLPNDYNQRRKKYPVLYMFDGHNLFFDEEAAFGKSWGMKEYLEDNDVQLIVVGIQCSFEGNERMSEYCPYDLENYYGEFIKGKGNEYLEWMINVIKPMIDSQYRTKTDRKNTLIGGSSMGGLMAAYAGIKYSDVFSKCACLSPSFELCYDKFMEDVISSEPKKGTKFYMDIGSSELEDEYRRVNYTSYMLELCHKLQSKGANCYPRLIPGGEHNEASWEKQVPVFMEYLL
ncbi:MAG: alpha/beta hydrolase-fold protein [Intestinibacter sp.]|uniref:alpha/beta hydrolase n=1 Tax=Intestinibacter sp. TaxID=1965304 RepID=UPI002A81DB05|nr:alpha/beta hydrolase-fold protein [Intestinibacter sp.]MDY4574128.1 alpha/beta hydrolase-fold protein [Intestinibacter sp.]